MVTYILQQPIRPKLFNHKYFVESFDINSFIQNKTIISGHSENSLFIDLEHDHILTGNLWIVCNNKLREQITKGPKDRELLTICRDKAESSIIDGMNGAAERLSNELSINKIQFSEWKNAILSHTDFQIHA